MDLLALVPFFLLCLGLLWALWLIFKRNMLDQNLTKLVSYFFGVIITFAVIGWLIDSYLPQWAAQRLINTRASDDVQTIETVGREIWQEAMGNSTTQPVVITTPVAQPTVIVVPATPAPTTAPGTTPAPTVSPVTPEGNNSGAVTGQSVGTALQPGEILYTVASGDNLYRISQQFGVSWQAIQQRNNLPSTAIQIGQTLIIPAK